MGLPRSVMTCAFGVVFGVAQSPRPGMPNVTLHHIEQNIDHFGFDSSVGTYSQRYFRYDGYASPLAGSSRRKVIFFYCGNEDSVELYVNNTGIMYFNL